MAEPTSYVIDKSMWGDGPWQTEPDRVDFEHAGLPCLLLRNHAGTWCGYAAVPPGHPLHGKGYDDLDVEVHGGLTYASACRDRICHVPKPGEPDDVWWFGFDCGHYRDFSPGIDALLRSIRSRSQDEHYDHATAVAAQNRLVEVYRDLAYVRAETERLADQLAAVWLAERVG